MWAKGVLISFKEKNQNSFYASGILLSSDLVLVPGNILLPFTHEEGWVSSFLNSTSAKLKQNFQLNEISFRVFFESKKENHETNFFECRVAGVWKCPIVSASIKKLLSEWTLEYTCSKKEEWELSTEAAKENWKELLSVFLLLRRENKLGEYSVSDDISILANLRLGLEEPVRGQRVEIVSTPFGNEHLMNSWSRGIISNVIGIDKCILLSDARTAPGCEGGPIFTPKNSREKERKLIGLVICPLTWWKGEWVGLTIGVNLRPVLKMLLTQNDPTRVTRSVENKLSSNSSDLIPLDLVDETVVLIKSETCWGSGTVLSATSGLILTCSHVVRNDKKVYVLYKANLWPANVIFRSREGVAYDLAVIKTEENFIFQREIEFSESSAEIGDPVFAAGFPFFSAKDDLHIKPTIVYGSVSKVNSYMIQTTCCIQTGFSGGALFKNGKLLGIIVSNARDSTTGAYFPHINFCIPSSVFRNAFLKYISQKDVENLKELESSKNEIQMLWNLQTSKL